MRIRLLGTAAGGGFPQWNCNCRNCRGVRAGTVRAALRTQSSVAVSANRRDWLLLNASPDIGAQIAAYPPLWPREADVRGSGVDAVLLTNADLDHVLGLFQLREGRQLTVYASDGARRALELGLRMGDVLSSYCGVDWQVPPDASRPAFRGGLAVSAFALPGSPPRYLRAFGGSSDSIGYRIVDPQTGGRLVFVPDLSTIDEAIIERLADCDALLIDGTFWSDDEMAKAGVGTSTAAKMGHVPVGGKSGSLAHIARLPVRRKIYVHINNTNPMLIEDSAERAAVLAAGVEVGEDGMEIEI